MDLVQTTQYLTMFCNYDMVFACIIHSVPNYIGYIKHILNIFLANIIVAQTVIQHHNLNYNMPLCDGIICVGSSKKEQRVDSV